MTYTEVEEYIKNNPDKEIIVEDMDELNIHEKYIKLKYGSTTLYSTWDSFKNTIRSNTMPNGDWLRVPYRDRTLRILSDEEITLALL